LIKTISIFPTANLMGVSCNLKRRAPLSHFPTYKITAKSRSPGFKCQDAASKLQAILVKIVPKSPN
jgi:hypothetical protein